MMGRDELTHLGFPKFRCTLLMGLWLTAGSFACGGATSLEASNTTVAPSTASPEEASSIPDNDVRVAVHSQEGSSPSGDQDGDGVADAADACPQIPEDLDGFRDQDGCPDPDNDGDGVGDNLDACPNEAESRNGFEDTDGCPETDTDGDGIYDSVDRCPNARETVNGNQDEDGCPDQRTHHGTARLDRIGSPILFQSGRRGLADSGIARVREVAQILRANHSIRLVRIEGHADSIGSNRVNDAISLRRANWIRDMLLASGVRRDRLTTVGFGSRRLALPNDGANPANRRVTFSVLVGPHSP